MAHITNRRIQRLGSSSLIITIPKNWAARLGLSPGDNVIIIDEGDSLRVLPSNPDSVDERKTTVKVKLKEADENHFIEIVRCAYTKGLNSIVIEYEGDIKVDEDKIKRVLHYLGVDDIHVDEGNVIVRLPDISREELSLALKRLSSTIQAIIEKLEKSEVDGSRLLAGLDVLIMDVMRILTSPSIRRDIQKQLEASLAAQLQLLADYIKELYREGFSPEDRELLSVLRSAVSDVLGGIAVGSLKRISQAREVLDYLEEKLGKATPTKQTGILIAITMLLKRIIETSICNISSIE
ncbi:MAG: AbrB/MazE/SpoVT family DNA-binding domain-containing protein [Desulfurococcales archaeon]|nr:AbrB/MazE/SpoVT family DNA-binding domain-containing protein [Desulfurococcales archaeon]